MNPTISDRQVAVALRRVVGVVDPVLSVVATVDPLGLKERTKRTDPAPDSNLDKVLDVAAWVLNAADFPGTKAWDGLTVAQRSRWWVGRVGAVNNVIVAYPGVFGVLLNRLPIQDALGYGNQAIVLVAVAREHGVTDRGEQVALLAGVLSSRQLALEIDGGPDEGPRDGDDAGWTPFALARALWRTTGIVRAIPDELAKRPQPTRFFRIAGMLPVVGVVANYFGEFGALARAADLGQSWVSGTLGQAGNEYTDVDRDTVHKQVPLT